MTLAKLTTKEVAIAHAIRASRPPNYGNANIFQWQADQESVVNALTILAQMKGREFNSRQWVAIVEG